MHCSDQEAPQSLLKLNFIADKDSGWLFVVETMIEEIPIEHPLGKRFGTRLC